MALKVIETIMKEGKVVVTIEGADPEAVNSMEAKNLAIQQSAKCGYPHVGFNSTSGAYPVDENGETSEDQAKMAISKKIVAYRNDIALMQRI